MMTIAVYGGTKQAMSPISNACPRKYSAKAASVIKVLQVDRQSLSTLPLEKRN